ncbi:MAG: YggT family protein [Spirochaetes bacterium]|nr:YggT family protein [Spirochaetota bacterium]MBU0956577.1 YggT family protein [Spirochaetota bacterium]
MTILSTILAGAAFAANLYMILCIVRIFMSWLPGLSANPAARFIAGATDPYLSQFRRFKIFHAGNVDFSPIAAFALLSALSRGLTVAARGQLTLGLSLAILLEVIVSPISFLLGFFALLILARIIAYFAKWNSLHPVWRAIDALINPVLFRIKRFIYRDRIVNYMQGLITGLLVLGGARLGLNIVTSLLSTLFRTVLG